MNRSSLKFAVLPGAAIAFAMSAFALRSRYAPYVEGVDYLKMAQGQSGVYFYYAGRVVHPWLARAASLTVGVDAVDGFRLIAALTAILFCVALLMLFQPRSLRESLGLALITFVTPPVCWMIWNFYFQDLFFNALIAVLLLAYARSRVAVLPVLFLLMLTRESAILLGIAIIAVEWLRGKRRFAVSAGLVCLSGMLITNRLVAQAVPNKHGLSRGLVTILKAGPDLLHNLFGVVVWTNTNTDTTTCSPVWTFDLSHWVSLGRIHTVGVCGWEPALPLATAWILLTCFGLAFVLLWRCLRRTPPRELYAYLMSRPAAAVAFVYGALCLVGAPLLGTALSRYVVYAWPLAWYVPRVLLAPGGPLAVRLELRDYAPHVLLCWLSGWAWIMDTSVALKTLNVAVALALWWYFVRPDGIRVRRPAFQGSLT